MAKDRYPTPPRSEKKKRGRPSGKWQRPPGLNKSYRLLGEAARDMQDAGLIIKFQQFITMGRNPIQNYDGTDIIDDPSPSASPPTLEQKATAMKWLADRGWGMASQSVTVDMQLRSELPSAIDINVLGGIKPDLLEGLYKLLLPETTHTSDYIDTTGEEQPIPEKIESFVPVISNE